MKNNADVVTADVVTLVSRTRTFHTGYKDCFKCDEFLHDGSFRFERGKSYGILCDITEGGGGISWLLAGRDVVREEELDVFGRRYSAGETVEEGWLVCEGIPGVDRTVAQEIGMGLGSSGLGLSVDDVAEKFELSECRMDFKLRHGGWEGWRASAAIGYAMGKQIFCFPWLYTGMLMDVSMCGYFFYTEILKKEGSIVIVPSGSREVLEIMADEIIELDHSWLDREVSRFMGHMDEYRNMGIRPVAKKRGGVTDGKRGEGGGLLCAGQPMQPVLSKSV